MKRVVGKIYDSLPCFTTFVGHVGVVVMISSHIFLHVVYK